MIYTSNMKRAQLLIEGAATVLSVFAPPYFVGQQTYHPAQSALEAITGDWKRVGDDIWKSIESVKNEQQIQELR